MFKRYDELTVKHKARFIAYKKDLSLFQGKAGKVDEDLSAFKSCAFCRPKLSSWITVTLRCRKKKKTSLRRKKVLRIKQCKCIAQGNSN